MSECEYEQVDLDEVFKEAHFTRSDYAQVIFHNIDEVYPQDQDLECSYTITSLLSPTNKDWIGLYKVGWSAAASDYIVYKNVNLPESDIDGDIGGCITFSASELPSEDGEFYQLCYVTGQGGAVRGASTPFQFGRPPGFMGAGDEFVEVEDEDNDILVIRTRTAVLEEGLSRAAQEGRIMQKSLAMVEAERDSLLGKIVELERDLQAMRDEREELLSDLKLTQEKIEALHQEAADMQMAHENQADQLNILKQEKESIEARMIDNDGYVVSLREKIKVLVNEKDALVGRTKSLEEEKDLYRVNFSSSETTLTSHKVEIDQLKQRLAEAEDGRRRAEHEAEGLREAVAEERRKGDRHLHVARANKSHLDELSEKLRNAEDKLMAAEQCKQMLNKELDTQQQAFQKISTEWERSKTEAHSLKVKVAKVEERGRAQEQAWSDEIKYLQGCLDEKSKENDKLSKEVESWRGKLEAVEIEKRTQHEGPMFALQMAQQTLKERLAKKASENEELKKQLDDVLALKRKWEQKEMDLKREVVDLKEHLLMGQDSFRDKYIECQKLRADLRKALKLKSVSRPSSETKELSRQASSVEKELLRQASEVEKEEVEIQTVAQARENKETATEKEAKSDSESQTSIRSADLAADLTTSEIQTQLDDLGLELEKRKSQKARYKQLYLEEKEKNGVLQKHYFAELHKKDDELVRQRTESHDKMDVLQQKNNILTNALDRKAEEVRRLTEQLQAPAAQAFPPGGAVFYPPQQLPVAAYRPPLEAPAETLPLRFAGPNYPPAAHTNPFSQPHRYQVIEPTLPSPPPPPSAPASPSSSPAAAAAAAAAAQAVEALDPLGDTADAPATLAPPLTPLPPPLEPELTAEAKKAAVMAAMTGGAAAAGGAEEDDVTADDIFPEPDVVQTQPGAAESGDGADGEDERFMDAQGEPQRLCPVCSMIFPPDVADVIFLDHIDTHYGPVCPVCSRQFDDNFSSERFQQHVETHFDD